MDGNFGNDVPVWLNPEWADADVRITTGFVEPHFFAGFSGGPKLVAPGLAALDTVLVLHDAARIGDRRATRGVLEGNPVHDDVRAIAEGAGVTFGLDVILNRDKDIVAAFGGDLLPMHFAAAAAAKRMKGMSAAHQVVRPGGLIVCAAECRDGFPDHGSYREVLSSAASPRALLDEIEARPETVPDQWQVQIQARIQADCRVVMHTSCLSDADLAAAHLEQTADISALLARLSPDANVCVLPEGPQTIPYLTA
ncbi:lactate racemase domain-containing protein [Amycolatopsis acididurans]|uniref:lactate racemase domain-containing protein n=1 Tax=Amycolatopsis acididurans TaxID=2724524 RepID=UPI0028AEDD1B|nr:lactate racemase domain-containing protein [Amycolatopsis acididurans]